MRSARFLVPALLAASGAQAADAKFGADRHVARGIGCAFCHGQNYQKDPEFPEEKTCLKCHNKEALAAKTKKVKPTNPHAAPHNGDCTLCHLQHEKTENYCAKCHSFDFKVP